MPKKWKNSLDVKLQKLMEKEYIYIFDHVQKTIKVFMQIGLKMLKETAVANKSLDKQNAQFQIRKSRTCIFIRFYPCLQKINANLSQNNLKIDNEIKARNYFGKLTKQYMKASFTPKNRTRHPHYDFPKNVFVWTSIFHINE